MTVKTHRFNGVTYDIDLDTDCDGYCEAPKPRGNPCLYLAVPIDTKDGMRKLMHEMLHACNWEKTEAKVEQAAEDMHRLMWRLGFRIQQ